MKMNLFTTQMFILVVSYVIVFEMVIGGGGRLVEVYNISLRNAFFVFMFIFSILTVPYLSNKVFTVYGKLIFLYVLSAISSFLVMSMFQSSGKELTDAFVDIKLLSVMLTFPCIYYMAKNIKYNILFVVKICALIMAVIYILSVLALWFNLVDFESFYEINNTGEFFFSPYKTFVYKGFIYLAIGAFLFLFDKHKNKRQWFCFLICILALLLTRSRGLILSFLMISYIYYVVCYLTNNYHKIFAMLAFFIGIYCLLLMYINLYTERDAVSDSIRLNDFKFIIYSFNEMPLGLLFGFGSGFEISGRPQIENAYMNALIKQGILGCLLIISPLFMIIKNMLTFRFDNSFLLLFFSVCLIYFQSNFNPYINNTIGMFFVLYVLALSLLFPTHNYAPPDKMCPLNGLNETK